MIYDAVVIGGGPAGSTGAALLAKAGWRVALVEKNPFPRRKVCGEFISPTSLPLLDRLGLRSEFLAQAGPEIRRVGFFARDVALASPMPRAEGSIAGWGRALGRGTLDLLLLEAAERAGAKLFQPWKLAALQKTDATHICTLSRDDDAREIEARVILAACGSWERSPFSKAEIEPHKASDLLAFKAHFNDSSLPDDLMPLLVFPGGYGGMVHTDRGRVSLSCCIRRDILADCRLARRDVRASEAVLAHILQHCGGARDALRVARADGAWLSAGPIRPGIRRRYDTRCFFAGNIAGEAHPIVAEGISMAMQSAWLLAEELIRCRSIGDDAALARAGDIYSRRWKHAFAPRIRAAAVFAQLGMRPDVFAPALPVVRHFPQLLSWGARFSGKATQLVGASSADS